MKTQKLKSMEINGVKVSFERVRGHYANLVVALNEEGKVIGFGMTKEEATREARRIINVLKLGQ